ncbi:hypothetical protein AVP42_00712 [Agromyces sp. NDB4Y10]|uniref:Ig-like domain-containing protein n=1 Tax=Agromyces sp. NDB4Y10 TaxID=1775951 RepID=UPI0007B1A06B|nr:Ig-like domain-containing protein [Agromyces sp. NDB4Y10]KZE94785.1 hypothetical protein AVP42_00712 [Agromyces sp. NDB4Y10]
MIHAAVRIAIGAALAVLLVAGVGANGPGFSSAAFTSQTSNGSSAVGAAVDWTPPTVSVQNPGTGLKDTVSITAAASDAETGIRDVVVQVQAAGATTWTTLCTATASPYRCSWDTRTVPDGSYDLRAIATDNAGYTTTSALVRTTVANAFAVLLADPGDVVRGTVPLATTLQNAGTGTYSVRVEYAAAGSGTWRTLCSNLTAPYACNWNTASFANDYFDLRSVATLNGITTTSAVVTDVLVDNVAPTVAMTDPGTPLSGTVTLAASASDAHSGVNRVVIQYTPTGTTAWKDACTITAPPYSCRFDTTTVADGVYAFRAVATDDAGNSATSTTVSNRTVDNSVISISMEDPGAYLSGTVTLSTAANSSAGVKSIVIQRAPSGTGTWTTVCTITTTPYSCAWDTRTVADGLVDFRAILTDNANKQATSNTLSGRRIDNTPVRGFDVQTANGGATPGKVDTGDTMTFTYSEQMNPASIVAGWNGSALPVTLRLRDGNLLGLGNAGDTVDILRSGAAVNLGSVNLRQDYIKTSKTSNFNATLTATTATVNGVPVTVVQVTVGSLLNGGALRTVNTASAMVWSPTAAATDMAGNPCSTAPVTESGALDREF